MFQINRLFQKTKPQNKMLVERRGIPAIIDKRSATEVFLDKNKFTGQRVNCYFHFILPNENPYNQNNINIEGLMVLNAQGCCIYLDDTFTESHLKQIFPYSTLMIIKELTLIKENCPHITINDLSIRTAGLKIETHATGQILHFINLTETQLNSLITVCEEFSEPGDSEIG